MSYKLLLADDENLEREALTLFIQKSNCAQKISHIEECSNGTQVVQKALEFQPDIIILDIKMPGLSGLEALKKIRDQGCQAVAVISSAYNQFDYAVSAMQLGVINFLVKPVKESVFIEALENAFSVLEKNAGESLQIPEEKKKVLPDCVQKICSYIEENYSRDINLDEIADLCSYSRYHVSHLFREASGFTIFSYLLEVRMKKARELLKNTSMNIKEISSQIGFSDQNYFSNVFKRQTGSSPMEFRSNSQ